MPGLQAWLHKTFTEQITTVPLTNGSKELRGIKPLAQGHTADKQSHWDIGRGYFKPCLVHSGIQCFGKKPVLRVEGGVGTFHVVDQERPLLALVLLAPQLSLRHSVDTHSVSAD